MRKYRIHALVAAAYLGTFLATLDISIVNVALPTLQTELQTDLAGLQWVVNIYAVALSAVMLSAGPLGDRYGHKRVWLGSVLIFVVGSVICSLASQLPMLLWGRAVQGIAGAMLIPGAMPILAHAFPDPGQRARAIGGWSAFSALALICGPLVGGILVEHVGWQSIFLVNVPLGLLATVLGAYGIPERKHLDHAAFDPAGQALSMLWLGALSYGLIGIGEHGSSPERVLIPLTIAGGGFITFVWVELRVERPLFPIKLFRSRSLVLANLASFFLGFSSYSSLFFLSLFLQQVQGSSPEIAGWKLMPQFVMMALASLLFGRFVARFSMKFLMVTGYALIGLALCAMVVFNPWTPYLGIGLILAVLGFGTGLSVPATGMMVMGCVPPERAGIASATMNALRQTGMALGIAILGSIMSVYAVNRLTVEIQDSGPSHAAYLARRAIVDHVFPSTQPWVVDLHRSAMAGGFGLVMLCAGLACLAISGLLLFFFIHRPANA